MKARKCPASRNCTAWSGTMKLNRICFSEIASRMIKGAAGRRWRSPSTEATSVTPSFTLYVFWLFLIFCSFPLTSRLLSPSWSFPPLCCVPALSLRVTPGCFREQGARQHHSLGPWVCPNAPSPSPPPYPYTAFFIPLLFDNYVLGPDLAFSLQKADPYNAAPCSFLSWVKQSCAGGSCSLLGHSSSVWICSWDSSLYLIFQLSFQALSDPELLKPPRCGVTGVSP